MFSIVYRLTKPHAPVVEYGMEYTGVIGSIIAQINEKQIPLPADAVMIGKLFEVVENDGRAAVAAEITDGIAAGKMVRLSPDHLIGQRVRFVHFN